MIVAVDKGRGRTRSKAYAALSKSRNLKSFSVTRRQWTRVQAMLTGELSVEMKLVENSGGHNHTQVDVESQRMNRSRVRVEEMICLNT